MDATQSKTLEGNYALEIKSASGHTIIADEPEDLGGQNKGMSPYELIAAALAACTSATLEMYAQKKEWDLKGVKTNIKVIQGDRPADLPSIHREIELEGELDSKQKERLMTIANKCPIHKLLTGQIEINSEMR
ncbi:OsmC family protein [Brumimicrobium oceani]|uniref:Osmotically inducible protein OsmC n=1 Tax=Brumimicrobium oceani TaxID=2100725 RepID=A0A2U2X0Q7_9FLAO|nr:OsmC family protein [Brumimicrobium oceani]PWH81349.1 osmotically inducible protein OsmC [Brumimicrobium oceani]